MKSFIAKITVLISIGALIAPTGFAVARTPKNPMVYGAVNIQMLGVDEPAILASNPFYGLTDLMRGMKDSFASGRLEKAAVKLATLNLKAAQLLKIRSVAPDNTKSVNKALNEYQLAVYQYAIATSRLTAEEFSSSEGIEAVPQFIDSVIVNLRLIDDLLATSQTTFDQALLTEMFERLAQSTVKMCAESIGLKTVRAHLLETIPDDSFIAVRTAEMIAGLGKQAAALDLIDASQQLMALRVDLLDSVATRLTGGPAADSALARGAAPKAMTMSLSLMPAGSDSPIVHLAPEEVNDFSILAGSAAERIQTLSYLLSTSEFSQDTDLIALRNQLLIKVFSK